MARIDCTDDRLVRPMTGDRLPTLGVVVGVGMTNLPRWRVGRPVGVMLGAGGGEGALTRRSRALWVVSAAQITAIGAHPSTANASFHLLACFDRVHSRSLEPRRTVARHSHALAMSTLDD